MEEVINETVVEEPVKKTAAKKTNGKKATTTESAEISQPIEDTAVSVKTPKRYEPTDTIMCHSVFPGTFLFSGPKSKIVYPFEAPGDENLVEYQDILAALMAKKPSIMAPYIVIDDEELLEDVKWKQVKKTYEDMFAVKDMNKFLTMPFDSFKKAFNELPVGIKKNVMLAISTKVRDGEFSEMRKIRLVDEACGSNIAVLLQ